MRAIVKAPIKPACALQPSHSSSLILRRSSFGAVLIPQDLCRCTGSEVRLLGPDRFCRDLAQRGGERLGGLRSGDGVAPIADEGRDAADSKALRHGFLRAHFGSTFVA